MIRSQNEIKIESNSSTMSDLVFLLLIFFMITSTLISPNAVKLLLPESTSKTMAKQNVTVYIDESYNFFVGEQPAAVDVLEPMLEAEIGEVPGQIAAVRGEPERRRLPEGIRIETAGPAGQHVERIPGGVPARADQTSAAEGLFIHGQFK